MESVLSYLSLHEMYDIISHLKELAESKPDELRLLLISHPQIAEAIVHMQVRAVSGSVGMCMRGVSLQRCCVAL